MHALDGVSFDLGAGDAVAIVGESGCGKTTLGRLLLKLAEPTAGSIAFDGVALAGLDGERLRDFRRQAQLVFQNPFDALNPRFTIYRAVAEPLVNAGIDQRRACRPRRGGVPPRPPGRPRSLSRQVSRTS